ncbi:NADH-quinone oxidoreductase subunit NuoN [Paracoccus sp. S-4012]|uniref:NADH-quinone oxidoreductase subunit NuoN n=1 Tax=Paracoccus sp. S-4012 TaxID=2665648 RepID=UPI0012B06503|nr:NADH-quinone oxidoreductase subunit NuoN [Paracoccus sp. S-4012]MRX50584.1 NADH-quinone oxidoreductase subunit NuoN [Paracoccus sp. S-4012]
MTALDFATILPEAGLALYALVALMAGAFFGKDEAASAILWTTVAALLAAALAVAMRQPYAPAFGGIFIDDGFARFSKVLILVSSAAVLAMSANHLQRYGMLRFEVPILFTLSSIGMMLMVSAGDLLILYMGLELQSLSLYVLAAMRRQSERSSEAGLKYFVLGALSSGLILYGASLVYGFAGTTQFGGIVQVVQAGHLPTGLLFGLVFLLAGLAFKVSAVPFHMWTPDVYEGAPTPITALLASAPKVAGVALIARLMFGAFGQVPEDWTQILVALSLLSMFLGAFAGIGQTDFKRLMAYSSISHVGFALMGLAAGTALGVEAMLIYMAIYTVMNVGVFAFILSMERNGHPVTDLRSLNLFSRDEPLQAFAVLVLMFSLAGVPPLLGFFAKFAVLAAALDAGLAWLAVAGVIASVIAAYYYLRIVYYMYFGAENDPATTRMGTWQALMLGASAAILVFGAVTMFGVDDAAAVAAGELVAQVPAPAPSLDPVAIGLAPVD